MPAIAVCIAAMAAHDGDLAHVVVLVDRHLGQPRLQDRVQQVVVGDDLLDRPREVVVDVPEVAA